MLICRMSLQNIEAVSNKIVNRIQNSDKPKVYHITLLPKLFTHPPIVENIC